jgi:hypothetical protein
MTFEFNNNQRKYFGLHPVENSWERVQLSRTIVAYFDQDRIVKILNYGWGYVEYDAFIETINRQILIPKTARGKQQKLTIPRILKIKGSGIEFSGSFQGGNIHIYDNKRNQFFIKSFAEDGDVKNFTDIDNWISNYIAKAPSSYFDWLTDQLSQQKLRVKIEAGDIIAFKLTSTEFGFARILSNVFADRKRSIAEKIRFIGFHPRSLIVAPYAFFASAIDLNIEELIAKQTLPAVCIFDIDVYRGEMPIIGHRPLSEREKEIPFPTKAVTSATLNITKRDLEALMIDNRL